MAEEDITQTAEDTTPVEEVVTESSEAGGELPPEDVAIKERAKTMGWREKDEMKYGSAKWMDYKEFVKKADDELPVLRERSRYMERELKKVQQEKDQLLQSVVKQLAEQRNQTFTMKQSEVIEKMTKAEAEGDLISYKKHLNDLIEVEKLKPAPEPQKAEDVDPVIVEWINHPDNRWFTTEKSMYDDSVLYYQMLEVKHPNMTTPDKLKKTNDYIRQEYPEKFGIKERSRPSANAVEDGNASATRKAGKTWNDIPADLREVMERLVKSDKSLWKDNKESRAKLDGYRKSCIETYFKEGK